MLAMSDEQRQIVEREGTPVPIVDGLTRNTYVLLGVECISDPSQSCFTARIPSITAYGEGETAQAASLALCEALRGYLEAFGER